MECKSQVESSYWEAEGGYNSLRDLYYRKCGFIISYAYLDYSSTKLWACF